MNGSYPDIEKTVQEYVLGKLSTEEAEGFEAFFLSDLEIVDMVETAQSMHLALNSFSRNDHLSDGVEDGVKKSVLTKLLEFISIPVPAYSMAALLLAVTIAPQLLSYSERAVAPELQIVRFSSEATRSISNTLTIDFTNRKEAVGIFIKVARVDYRDYVLRLNGPNDAIWLSKPFQMSTLKDALVVVPNGVVDGPQSVELFGVSPTGQQVPVEFCNYNERCSPALIDR